MNVFRHRQFLRFTDLQVGQIEYYFTGWPEKIY